MNRILIFVVYLFFFACANIGSPSGGPRDETPPVLDPVRSTKNLQTNFEKQRITLVFDEFVDLKDVFNQVVVSPPLAFRPTVSKKKRTIRFDFDKEEILRPDATYTINFGEAVRDYTEGNVVPDLRFVFSTGPFIDSLEVGGKIVDALTGEPSEGVLVMLYDNLSDTVVRTERPFYFAKTAENGQFLIENVKSDTFKVFALLDANLNYRYDQENEMIGFPDNNITLSGDSILVLPTISLFQESPPLKIISKNPQSGLVKMTFNQVPEDINFKHDGAIENVSYEYEADTITMWYDWKTQQDWQLFINKDSSLFDTITVKTAEKEPFLEKRKLRLNTTNRKNQVNKFNPRKPIRLYFNHPITSVDTSKIFFFKDSTFNPLVPQISFNERELQLKYRWEEDSLYDLQILPTALLDIYGLSNEDTIIQKYKASSQKEFGNIILTVKGLDSAQHYVIQLFSKKNDNLVKEIPLQDLNEYQHRFDALSPGAYYLRIITDLNRNKRWDTGNYNEMIQPEPIFLVTLKDLRANWDVEEEITLIE